MNLIYRSILSIYEVILLPTQDLIQIFKSKRKIQIKF